MDPTRVCDAIALAEAGRRRDAAECFASIFDQEADSWRAAAMATLNAAGKVRFDIGAAQFRDMAKLVRLLVPAEPAGSGDADGGGDGNDDHPDVTAQRAIEGEPEPDTETMQSYSAHDAEFPAPASLARVTVNAEA